MKTKPENHCAAAIANLRHMLTSSAIAAGSMLALALPAAAGTVYLR